MNGRVELEQALAALPHGEPFRFVSTLTKLEPRVRGEGAWIVTGDEGFFPGHFPGEPIVPGVLIAEAVSQLCGLVAFSGERGPGGESKAARLAHIDVKVRAAVRPPARIELSATFVRAMGGLLLFDVAAAAGGAAVADGRIVLVEAV